jgi:predicted amidohydrolase
VRVALVQLAPRLGAVADNLALIAREVERAAAAGAELALLPELALCGYRLRDLVPHVAVRLDQPGPERRRLEELSRVLPFVVGLVEESPDHRFFNSAAYWEDGRLVHVHRKCYLPTYGMFDEAMDFSPGERLSAFDTRFGRVGLLLCEDAWHPSATTVLAQDGAHMVWVLSAAPLRGSSRTGGASLETWRELLRTLARFNTLHALWVNRAGFEDGLGFAGGSFAVAPDGATLASGRELEPDLVVVELDPERLRAARAAYPLVRDERTGLVVRELTRIMRRRFEEERT